jgi:RNA polymerase sigma-54 factor
MLKQVGTQSQHFHVLPQQIQLLKLFHLTTLDLQHRIQVELNDNPMLEAEAQDEETTKEDTNKEQDFLDTDEYVYDDIPDYKLEHNNYLAEDQTKRPFAEPHDFRKTLKEQLTVHLNQDTDFLIADFLINSLNEDGLLDSDVSAISDDISFQNHLVVEPAQVACVLTKLQQIEPCGMGCRSMKDFLLFQLRSMIPSPRITNCITLLSHHFLDLSRRNMEKIASSMAIPETELREMIRFIGALPMKPFSQSQSSAPAPCIIPDFIITEEGGRLQVALYRQRSSVLFVNQSMSSMLEKEKKGDKATLLYLKSKLSSAQWFVDAIKQRETTMLSIMNEVVRFQAAYFQEGDIRLLKPMILKNIAEKINMDISTVSRITCNKYADTPFGTIALKSLFSEGVANDEGTSISNRVIQLAIREVVNVENVHAPYTDRQLVTILSTKGFAIARRTVSKYREHLRIPTAELRTAW